MRMRIERHVTYPQEAHDAIIEFTVIFSKLPYSRGVYYCCRKLRNRLLTKARTTTPSSPNVLGRSLVIGLTKRTDMYRLQRLPSPRRCLWTQLRAAWNVTKDNLEEALIPAAEDGQTSERSNAVLSRTMCINRNS